MSDNKACEKDNFNNNSPLKEIKKIGGYYDIIGHRIESTRLIIDTLNLECYQKELVKTNLIDFVKLMEKLTRRSIRQYNLLNITSLISGALVPVIININLNAELTKYLATALGVIASITMAINQSYRLNDKWRHYRHVSEQMKIEGEMYLSLCGKYEKFKEKDGDNSKDVGHAGAFSLFINETQSIKDAQIETFIKKLSASEDRKMSDNTNEK